MCQNVRTQNSTTRCLVVQGPRTRTLEKHRYVLLAKNVAFSFLICLVVQGPRTKYIGKALLRFVSKTWHSRFSSIFVALLAFDRRKSQEHLDFYATSRFGPFYSQG